MAIKSNIYYCVPIYDSYIDYESINKFLTQEQLLEIENVKKNIDKKFLIKDCYCRIEHLTGGKRNIEFKLYVYDADIINLIEIRTFSFIPSIVDNSDNFIKQGYEYLKTLDEYKYSVDILEQGQSI